MPRRARWSRPQSALCVCTKGRTGPPHGSMLAPLLNDEDVALCQQTNTRYRTFLNECDAACMRFERSSEWADLIHCLQQLQRVLNKYSSLPVIPDKVLVAKRLYQCLNPALPSGVHKKTLETIELIFSRIGPDRLARDLAFYSEGIFPLYRHASYQVTADHRADVAGRTRP